MLNNNFYRRIQVCVNVSNNVFNKISKKTNIYNYMYNVYDDNL